MMLEILLLATSHGGTDCTPACDHGPDHLNAESTHTHETYVPWLSSNGGSSRVNSWAPGSTVTFVYESLATPPPNHEVGTPPRTACNAAMQAWNAIADITLVDGGEVAGLTCGLDGVNAVTFTDPLATTANSLALALVFINGSGQIIESDVVFSATVPFDATPPLSNTAFDTQSIATHEFGHALGLDHSGVVASTMYPVIIQGDLQNRSPERDDIAGINFLYPRPGFAAATGSITGQVTIGNPPQPVFGAHVVARDFVSGVSQVGAVTDTAGNYTITGLRPGIYEVYAEPLDGPVSIANLDAPFWVGQTLDTGFVQSSLVEATVDPAGQAQVDLLVVGTPNANIEGARLVFSSGTTVPIVFNVPVRVTRPLAGQPNVTGTLYVRGTGINPTGSSNPTGPLLDIPGPGISVSAPTGGGIINASNNTTQYVTYTLTVTSQATPGGHDIEANTYSVATGIAQGGDVRYCGGLDIVEALPGSQAYAYGTGCAPSGTNPLALTPSGPPAIGASYTMSIPAPPTGQTAYLTNSAFAGIGPVLVGNCATLINVNPLFLLPSPFDIMPGVNASGLVVFDFSAGLANPALSGLEFHSQAVSVDNATGAITATSNGVKTIVF